MNTFYCFTLYNKWMEGISYVYSNTKFTDTKEERTFLCSLKSKIDLN